MKTYMQKFIITLGVALLLPIAASAQVETNAPVSANDPVVVAGSGVRNPVNDYFAEINAFDQAQNTGDNNRAANTTADSNSVVRNPVAISNFIPSRTSSSDRSNTSTSTEGTTSGSSARLARIDTNGDRDNQRVLSGNAATTVTNTAYVSNNGTNSYQVRRAQLGTDRVAVVNQVPTTTRLQASAVEANTGALSFLNSGWLLFLILLALAAILVWRFFFASRRRVYVPAHASAAPRYYVNHGHRPAHINAPYRR